MPQPPASTVSQTRGQLLRAHVLDDPRAQVRQVACQGIVNHPGDAPGGDKPAGDFGFVGGVGGTFTDERLPARIGEAHGPEVRHEVDQPPACLVDIRADHLQRPTFQRPVGRSERVFAAARVGDGVVAQLVTGLVHLSPAIDLLFKHAFRPRVDVKRASQAVSVQDRRGMLQMGGERVVKAEGDRAPSIGGPNRKSGHLSASSVPSGLGATWKYVPKRMVLQGRCTSFLTKP